MDELKAIESIGFTMPSPAYIFGVLMFSIIGFAAWRYGKKGGYPIAMWLGVALMFFPYAVSETWLLYLIGGALCVGLAFSRR
jgi:hypothetical protein